MCSNLPLETCALGAHLWVITADDFRDWRLALGLSQAGAARALGLSRSSVLDYERGFKRGTDRAAPVPRVVELACRALQMAAAE